METEHLHVTISGLVQGVFFRASTREMALRLGLKGWVRNLPDGRVEALFEGQTGKLQEALTWCRKGPPGARVTDVHEKWSRPDRRYGTFEIRYR